MSLGEAACSDAAAAAFIKISKHSKWLRIKQGCQERLLPLKEVSELVMQATDQTLAGTCALSEVHSLECKLKYFPVYLWYLMFVVVHDLTVCNANSMLGCVSTLSTFERV